MTISIAVSQMRDAQERVRREHGEAAAKELAHGQVGACLGMGSGAMKGALIGSIIPGIGTGIGSVIGGAVGFFMGSRDKNGSDNLRSAAGYAVGAGRLLGK